MKIFFKSRNAQRNSKITGKRVDCGTNAAKRWAIELQVKKN